MTIEIQKHDVGVFRTFSGSSDKKEVIQLSTTGAQFIVLINRFGMCVIYYYGGNSIDYWQTSDRGFSNIELDTDRNAICLDVATTVYLYTNTVPVDVYQE